MIDIKQIKELIKLMVSNDLTELDLESEGERIGLKRGVGDKHVQFVSPPPVAAAPVAAAAPSVPAGGQDHGGPGGAGVQLEPGRKAITSPMVGTFYSSPNPDSKPFISVGDRVGPDQVVCIIEAMKVFNEIKADVAGTVEQVLAESGQAVEFEQAMFVIKPD